MKTEMLFLEGSNPGDVLTNIFFIVAMIAVFYFFMIRPQNKKRKKLEEMRTNLKKGDHVLTIGGIHGKVAEVKETTIVLQVEGGIKLKVEKSAVSLDSSTQLTEDTAKQAAMGNTAK